MFKFSIALTISLLSLSGLIYAQEKEGQSVPEERSIPAFFMPATVARTTMSPPDLPTHPSTPAVTIHSSGSLQYHDPESGTIKELHTTKPIRIVEVKKNRPSKPTPEKK